jgi:hypothetical protein
MGKLINSADLPNPQADYTAIDVTDEVGGPDELVVRYVTVGVDDPDPHTTMSIEELTRHSIEVFCSTGLRNPEVLREIAANPPNNPELAEHIAYVLAMIKPELDPRTDAALCRWALNYSIMCRIHIFYKQLNHQSVQKMLLHLATVRKQTIELATLQAIFDDPNTTPLARAAIAVMCLGMEADSADLDQDAINIIQHILDANVDIDGSNPHLRKALKRVYRLTSKYEILATIRLSSPYWLC